MCALATHEFAEPAHQIRYSCVEDFHRLLMLFHKLLMLFHGALVLRQPFAMLFERPALTRFELRGHRDGIAQFADRGVLGSQAFSSLSMRSSTVIT